MEPADRIKEAIKSLTENGTRPNQRAIRNWCVAKFQWTPSWNAIKEVIDTLDDSMAESAGSQTNHDEGGSIPEVEHQHTQHQRGEGGEAHFSVAVRSLYDTSRQISIAAEARERELLGLLERQEGHAQARERQLVDLLKDATVTSQTRERELVQQAQGRERRDRLLHLGFALGFAALAAVCGYSFGIIHAPPHSDDREPKAPFVTEQGGGGTKSAVPAHAKPVPDPAPAASKTTSDVSSPPPGTLPTMADGIPVDHNPDQVLPVVPPASVIP